MKVVCYVWGGERTRERADVRDWLAAAAVPPADVAWYADDGDDDPEGPRPGLDRLRAAVAAGEVRAVVLWKLDRLGPRLQDGIATLADWGTRGLKVVVVGLRLEFDGEVGRSLSAVLLGLAEAERDFRQRRQAAGIADARARGAYRGRVPGTTKGDPARVRELRGKGLTVPEIAQAIGVSERTVTRYLAQAEDAG